MKQIILSKTDYSRIQRSIEYAKMKNSIRANEAENLLNELSSALIVDPHEVPPDLVTMNSIVKINFLDSNRTMQFQIVYPGAADIKKSKISIFSPVATALIGYRVSDEIEWIVPSGLTRIRIEEIVYQPEAAGQFHL
jgi:regulator of nucleoside diphosphate kinase